MIGIKLENVLVRDSKSIDLVREKNKNIFNACSY